jgi:acyl carrier protein
MLDVSERIKKILVDLYCIKPEVEIHDHSTLRGDLNLDSLDAVEFIMAL